MIRRDNAIGETKEWIKAQKDVLGLKALKRTPTAPVDSSRFPAIFIHEGDDTIIKPGKQHWHGYPAVRKVEVVYEMWANSNADIRAMYEQLRNILLSNKLSDGSLIKESRAFGPFNGGISGAVCMQLVMELSYLDDGPALSS